MPVEKGDKVKIEYTGKLDDGSVFDSSEKHGQPLEFEAGSGQVIKGFDEAVMGMEMDEEKEVSIQSQDAYGDRKDELVRDIPRDSLPQDQEPKEGMVIGLQTPDGQQFPGTIVGVDEKNIKVDLNHPLAGKNLNFSIKLVGKE
ncbi:MAG: FKBP-type peptidyl-prolyl cis-trans isomerase [Nanoarchaeota archaeon]